MGQSLIFAIFSGSVPPLIWLLFWVKSEEKHKEPFIGISIAFLIGAISVILALPIEKIITEKIISDGGLIIALAATEEIVKALVAIIFIIASRHLLDPIDFPMYFIIVALGFASLENVLFVLQPSVIGEITVSVLTSWIRFLGSSLLHTIASGTIGVALALSMHKGKAAKWVYFISGLAIATAMHSAFNFFTIFRENSLWGILGVLWALGVIFMLLMEKIRRIS